MSIRIGGGPAERLSHHAIHKTNTIKLSELMTDWPRYRIAASGLTYLRKAALGWPRYRIVTWSWSRYRFAVWLETLEKFYGI